MDKSNGYEAIAATFIEARGKTIGIAPVRNWARTLALNSTILDLGCGTGLPISQALLEEGMTVYGVDASPSLAKAFQQHFPNSPIACEPAEESSFFNRKFDGIISWGLLFLMAKEEQVRLIEKISDALKTEGKLLFTAPYEKAEWIDVLTGQQSISLGAKTYQEVLSASGLSLLETFVAESGNHYYSAVKI